MEGVAENKGLIDRFEAVSARFAEEIEADEMTALIAEQGELQEKIDAADAWDLQRTVEIAMDALRCPPGDAESPSCPAASAAAWRCAGCCCRARICCCSTSRPTTSMPNPSPGSSASCTNTQARSSPSPTTAISSTTSRAGSWSWTAAMAFPGRATTPPGWSRRRSGWRWRRRQESARQRTLERELEWIRQSPRARQAKSKARIAAYEKLLAEAGGQQQTEAGQINIPAGPRLGDMVIEAEHLRRATATGC